MADESTQEEKVTPPVVTPTDTPPLQGYFFPRQMKTIQATSLAEAMTKLEDLIKKENK